MEYLIYLLKIISFIIGAYIFYISILLYDKEEKRLVNSLNKSWRKLKKKVESNELTYSSLKNLYFENLKNILKKLIIPGSIYSAIGTVIVLCLIPYLFYRLYWITFEIKGWSITEYLVHYGFRIPLILYGIYLISSLISPIEERRNKAIFILEHITLSLRPLLLIVSIYLCTSFYFFKNENLNYSISLSVQYLTGVLTSISLLLYIAFLYKVLLKSISLLRAILTSAFGVFYVLHVFVGVYIMNKELIFKLFGEKNGEFYIETVDLFNQLFAMMIFPIGLSIVLLVMHFIIFLSKPFTDITARILHAIHKNNLLSNKKLMLIIAGILCSFLFNPIKMLLKLVEIGI